MLIFCTKKSLVLGGWICGWKDGWGVEPVKGLLTALKNLEPVKGHCFVIKKLYAEKLKLTNHEITQSLIRNNCPQLTKRQINNLKGRLKRERLGAANCCLFELKMWCEKKRTIPDDEDEIFCGGFEFLEEDGTIAYIRLFITTKRLISLIKISHKSYYYGKYIHIFLTYSLG